jgi:hypothetical protein
MPLPAAFSREALLQQQNILSCGGASSMTDPKLSESRKKALEQALLAIDKKYGTAL